MASENESRPAPGTPETSGGLGGGSADPGIRDARLAEGAFRQRWPIDAEIRREVMQKLAVLVRSPKERTVLAAARALIAAEQQNQSDEHKGQPDIGVNLNLTSEDFARMTPEQIREYIANLDSAAAGARQSRTR